MMAKLAEMYRGLSAKDKAPYEVSGLPFLTWLGGIALQPVLSKFWSSDAS